MSLLKSEARIAAVNELGSRLDDVLEVASKDLQKEEGAVTALRNAVSALENLMKVVSKDLDDKLVDLETQVVIKKYVDRARSIVASMAASAENSRQAQVGKISAFEHAVGIAKKYRDEEFRKFSAMKVAIEKNLEADAPGESQNLAEAPDGEQVRRPVGVRPPPPIKMQRLIADAIAESNSSKVNSPHVDDSHDKVLSELTESSSGESTEEAPVKKTKKQKK